MPNIIVYYLLHLPDLAAAMQKVIPGPRWDRNLEAMLEFAFFLTYDAGWNRYRHNPVLRRLLELTLESWCRCRFVSPDATTHGIAAMPLSLCRGAVDESLWDRAVASLTEKLKAYFNYPGMRADECTNHLPPAMAAAALCGRLTDNHELQKLLENFIAWFSQEAVTPAGFVREFGGPNSGWSAQKSCNDLSNVHRRLPGTRAAQLASRCAERYFHWWAHNAVPAGEADGERLFAYNQAPQCTRTSWCAYGPYPHFGYNNYWAAILPQPAALSSTRPSWQLDTFTLSRSADAAAAVDSRPFVPIDFNGATWSHAHWVHGFSAAEGNHAKKDDAYLLPAARGGHYSLFEDASGKPGFLFFGTPFYYAAMAFGEVRRLYAFGHNELTLLAASPKPDSRRRGQRQALKGDIPNPAKLPSGCIFHTRCPLATKGCSVRTPELRRVGLGRSLYCHQVEV